MMTLFERQNASVNKFALTLKDFYTVSPTALPTRMPQATFRGGRTKPCSHFAFRAASLKRFSERCVCRLEGVTSSSIVSGNRIPLGSDESIRLGTGAFTSTTVTAER